MTPKVSGVKLTTRIISSLVLGAIGLAVTLSGRGLHSFTLELNLSNSRTRS